MSTFNLSQFLSLAQQAIAGNQGAADSLTIMAHTGAALPTDPTALALAKKAPLLAALKNIAAIHSNTANGYNPKNSVLGTHVYAILRMCVPTGDEILSRTWGDHPARATALTLQIGTLAKARIDAYAALITSTATGTADLAANLAASLNKQPLVHAVARNTARETVAIAAANTLLGVGSSLDSLSIVNDSLQLATLLGGDHTPLTTLSLADDLTTKIAAMLAFLPGEPTPGTEVASVTALIGNANTTLAARSQILGRADLLAHEASEYATLTAQFATITAPLPDQTSAAAFLATNTNNVASAIFFPFVSMLAMANAKAPGIPKQLLLASYIQKIPAAYTAALAHLTSANLTAWTDSTNAPLAVSRALNLTSATPGFAGSAAELLAAIRVVAPNFIGTGLEVTGVAATAINSSTVATKLVTDFHANITAVDGSEITQYIPVTLNGTGAPVEGPPAAITGLTGYALITALASSYRCAIQGGGHNSYFPLVAKYALLLEAEELLAAKTATVAQVPALLPAYIDIATAQGYAELGRAIFFTQQLKELRAAPPADDTTWANGGGFSQYSTILTSARNNLATLGLTSLGTDALYTANTTHFTPAAQAALLQLPHSPLHGLQSGIYSLIEAKNWFFHALALGAPDDITDLNAVATAPFTLNTITTATTGITALGTALTNLAIPFAGDASRLFNTAAGAAYPILDTTYTPVTVNGAMRSDIYANNLVNGDMLLQRAWDVEHFSQLSDLLMEVDTSDAAKAQRAAILAALTAAFNGATGAQQSRLRVIHRAINTIQTGATVLADRVTELGLVGLTLLSVNANALYLLQSSGDATPVTFAGTMIQPSDSLVLERLLGNGIAADGAVRSPNQPNTALMFPTLAAHALYTDLIANGLLTYDANGALATSSLTGLSTALADPTLVVDAAQWLA